MREEVSLDACDPESALPTQPMQIVTVTRAMATNLRGVCIPHITRPVARVSYTHLRLR